MIIDRLTEDMKAAMKAGDKTRLGTIRMLMAELKNAKIAKGDDLDDGEEEKLLASYAKKRKESIDAARDAGREEMALKEEQEHKITMEYLPEQMGEDDLRGIVKRHIDASDGGMQAFGLVMKAVMAEVGSQSDGKTVSALVKEMLK